MTKRKMSCLTPVDSEVANVEDVPLRERIKPLKIAGDTQTVKKLVEMRHPFTASPDAGSDLYVKAVASVAAAVDTSTTLLGDCQGQQPAGGSDPGPSSGSGAIIPIASDLPVTMSTTIGRLTSAVAVAGFGRSQPVTLIGGAINLTGGSDHNFAFSMPRDGVITPISGYFSTVSTPVLVGTTVTVTASLFCSATPDDTFAEVPGSAVTLAPVQTVLSRSGRLAMVSAPAWPFRSWRSRAA